ncbi:MAG: DUF4255 domain-containing protein [Deltaproteobacteria bacterium]|nr:DUF4255 domain-containing protein [Deltaproteobacteria bacterium]
MINTAIQTITESLNDYLKAEFNLNEEIVVLSNLLEQDGSVTPNLENRIAVFVINVEKDTSRGPTQSIQRRDARNVQYGFDPVCINIYLVFAFNFNGRNYEESLKFLSQTIGFFQRHPVWDHHNTPGIDPRVSRLCMDIVNLDIKDLSNLWGVISSKYIPSVIYKIRTFIFESSAIRKKSTAMRDPSRSLEN